MAQTDEERQASNVDSVTAPEQGTPGAAVLPRPPVLVAVLDSGATIHAVSDGRFLTNIRHLRSPMAIRVADGRPVYAYEVGDIDTEQIKLKNVYLVPDLKANLVSVRELAKTGIFTTFYMDDAELRKGEEVVGRAIAQGNKSLYQLTFLRATGDDASDTTPEVPSGSEPGMVAAVLPRLEEVVRLEFRYPTAAGCWLPKGHFNTPLITQDDLAVIYDWAKYPENMFLMPQFKSLDNTAVYSAFPKPEYSQYPSLVSKFCQCDKTGGGECCNKKFRDGSVRVKAHMGPDPDGMHEADFIKSLKD